VTRLAMPDSAVRGVTIEGARTGRETRYAGRIVDVANPQHERALRDLGCFPVTAGGVTRAAGRVCTVCGFGSFFTTCSRCGGVCEKE
jgi:hypothetical protein